MEFEPSAEASQEPHCSCGLQRSLRVCLCRVERWKEDIEEGDRGGQCRNNKAAMMTTIKTGRKSAYLFLSTLFGTASRTTQEDLDLVQKGITSPWTVLHPE